MSDQLDKQNSTPSPEPDCVIPHHPFFDPDIDQASFIDCIDAIDRVKAMIELADALDLEDHNGGLTPNAAFGYFWTTMMTRGTLSYVSNRLVVLEKQNAEKHKLESRYLSALVRSLHSLGRGNRERLLNSVAGELNIKRSTLDEFVRKKGKP